MGVGEALSEYWIMENEFQKLCAMLLQVVTTVREETTVSSTDERIISPWLRSTNWHVYLQDENATMIHNLVAMPTQDDFPHLSAVVRSYLKDTMLSITRVNILVRQKLNTNDPQTG